MKILVVIPAYNEELNIEKVVNEIKLITKYEYLIIDDCSSDSTYEICLRNRYNVLHLPINYGLASAIQVGFKYAIQNNYDAVLQFDGDGQHIAEYIDCMVEALEEGNDIVIGSRFANARKPFSARMLGSRLLTQIILLMTGKRINDPTSGMRLFGKSVLEEYASHMNFPPEPDTLVYMLKKGKKIKEVQVQMRDREFGESYLNAIRSLKYMLEITVSIVFIQSFRKR